MIGPAADPALKLKALWTISGVGFHVEAFRVKRIEHVQQLDVGDLEHDVELNSHLEDFDDLTSTFVPSGGFATLRLDNNEYVLFIFPFSFSFSA